MPSNSILNIKKDGEWIEIPALKGEDGFFYEKIEYCCPFYEKAKDTVKVPENSDKGSDFNKDNKENHE